MAFCKWGIIFHPVPVPCMLFIQAMCGSFAKEMWLSFFSFFRLASLNLLSSFSFLLHSTFQLLSLYQSTMNYVLPTPPRTGVYV